jgi:NADH-quinone oxidoreductase subunit M
MGLGRALPFAATTFVLAALASMGLPGFSGFVAELQVLIGAWSAFPTAGVGAGIGIVIGVAYLLRAVQRAFFADGVEQPAQAALHELPPISWPERLGAGLLLLASLVVGLYPQILLNLISPSVASLLETIRKGGAL